MNNGYTSDNSTNSGYYFSEVMDRLSTIAGVKRDKELADLLGMKVTTYSNRKKKGSVPYENIIGAASHHGWDLDWIFTGKHAAPTAIYSKRDQATGNQHMVQDGAAPQCNIPKSDGLQSTLNDLKLLEAVIRVVLKVRPDFSPNEKAKLIAIMIELHRAKYGQEPQQNGDDYGDIDEVTVIRLASVLSK